MGGGEASPNCQMGTTTVGQMKRDGILIYFYSKKTQVHDTISNQKSIKKIKLSSDIER